MGITTAIALAATAASSAYAASQQRKAAKEQQAALDKIKGTDIEKTAARAKEADLQQFKDSLQAQRDLDPATARLRDISNEQLAQGDPQQAAVNRVLSDLFSTTQPADARDTKFIETLKTRAQEELDRGGALSGEQQSELVRAGLEQAGASGVGAGSVAGRRTVGRLLASETERLRQERGNVARELFGFATDLQSRRIDDASRLVSTNQNVQQQRLQRLFNLANLADSRVPTIGLGGSDIANLEISNQNLKRDKIVRGANIAANSRTQQAATIQRGVGGLVSIAKDGGLFDKF